MSLVLAFLQYLKPREGVIIECPQNGLFHDARDLILTSRMAPRDLADDDDLQMLGNVFYR